MGLLFYVHPVRVLTKEVDDVFESFARRSGPESDGALVLSDVRLFDTADRQYAAAGGLFHLVLFTAKQVSVSVPGHGVVRPAVVIGHRATELNVAVYSLCYARIIVLLLRRADCTPQL